jgi:endo-1,4-beta-xylanase
MEFIEKAFIWAHEADPDVILRYNDYSLENAPKRAKLIKLIKELQAKNIPVMAIGSQTHVNLTWPTLEQEDQALTEMASLGLPIHITELDVKAGASGQRVRSGAVDANAGLGGGAQAMDEKTQEALAKQYVNLFTAFCKHSKDVKLVTFWNVTDADSWLRGQNPLLFDSQGNPKPAYEAVLKLPETLKN